MTLSEEFDDRSMSPEPVDKTKIQACHKFSEIDIFGVNDEPLILREWP